MTFTQVTGELLVQPSLGGISCDVSGNVYKGQGVYLVSDKTIKAPTSDDKVLFGIAMANATDSQKVTVFSVGNLVKCKLSSSSTLSVGTFVGVTNGGFISDSATYNSGAVITKEADSNYGTGEIHIIGTTYSL